jgi:hypothetical protein
LWKEERKREIKVTEERNMMGGEKREKQMEVQRERERVCGRERSVND